MPVDKQVSMQTNQMERPGGLSTPPEVGAMHPDCKYKQHSTHQFDCCAALMPTHTARS